MPTTIMGGVYVDPETAKAAWQAQDDWAAQLEQNMISEISRLHDAYDQLVAELSSLYPGDAAHDAFVEWTISQEIRDAAAIGQQTGDMAGGPPGPGSGSDFPQGMPQWPGPASNMSGNPPPGPPEPGDYNSPGNPQDASPGPVPGDGPPSPPLDSPDPQPGDGPDPLPPSGTADVWEGDSGGGGFQDSRLPWSSLLPWHTHDDTGATQSEEAPVSQWGVGPDPEGNPDTLPVSPYIGFRPGFNDPGGGAAPGYGSGDPEENPDTLGMFQLFGVPSAGDWGAVALTYDFGAGDWGPNLPNVRAVSSPGTVPSLATAKLR